MDFHRTARALRFESRHIIPNGFLDTCFFLGGGVEKVSRYGLPFLDHGMVPNLGISNENGGTSLLIIEIALGTVFALRCLPCCIVVCVSINDL